MQRSTQPLGRNCCQTCLPSTGNCQDAVQVRVVGTDTHNLTGLHVMQHTMHDCTANNTLCRASSITGANKLVTCVCFDHSHAVPGSQVPVDKLALGQILHSLSNVQADGHQHRYTDALQPKKEQPMNEWHRQCTYT